jgi:hypothetical protein
VPQPLRLAISRAVNHEADAKKSSGARVGRHGQ